MTTNTSLSARTLTSILLRTYMLIQLVKGLLHLAGAVYLLQSSFIDTKVWDASSRWYPEIEMASGLAFIGASLWVYLRSDLIARWVFREDFEISFGGDPFQWALPALQIVGLVLLVDAVSLLFPTVMRFYQNFELALATDTKSFWTDVWTIAVKSVVGFLLFNDPRWLVDRMRRNALNSR
jgi:hypothetical protein